MSHFPSYRFVPPPSPPLPPAYVRVGSIEWALVAILVVTLLIFGAEPYLGAACVMAVPIGVMLLWRSGEPPILFAAFFLQWLSVSTAVIQANLKDIALVDLFDAQGIVMATWLSLAGVLVLAVAMRFAMRGVRPQPIDALRSEVSKFHLLRIVEAYAATSIVLLVLAAWVWRIPGLSQLLLALTGFRWAFFFILAVTVLVKRRGYLVLGAASVYELVQGLSGYFADYKMVFFVLALAIVTARARLSRFTVAKMAFVFAGVLTMSAVWSLVKLDYRDYVSGDSGEQVLLVAPVERLTEIARLIGDLELRDLPDGFQRLADRIQYTEYFGEVVDRIPKLQPHENGRLWWAAVQHVAMPRLFFPDKPELTADVEKTEAFSGLDITSQAGRHTEIPLGYMAESYIDFGPLGMFVPIALLGLLYGAQYRYFVTRPRHFLFAYGSAIAALHAAVVYEMSAVKVLGGTLTSFIAVYLVFRYAVPALQRWLMKAR